MQIQLNGKTAIITGSTKGIGLAAAKALAATGAKVVITGRTQDSVDTAIAAVKSEQPDASVKGVAVDLETAEGCKALIDAMPACDMLVNNVGIYQNQDFFDIDDDEWQRYYDVNVMSAVRLSRHYAKGMVNNGWGRLLYIASESAVNIPADMIHYGVSKSALLGLSRGIAKRLAATGVTANAVLPGPTLSEGATAFLEEVAKEKGITVEEAGTQFILENRPSSIIQRFATTEEVASMIVYACSEQASATTGSALRVDGGVVDFIM